MSIVWFRKDLRCFDNPALNHAIESGSQVLPLFIWSPDEEHPWVPGAASRWWLHHALKDLKKQLAQLGLELIVVQGNAEDLLPRIADALTIKGVYWNRRYEEHIVKRDARIKERLKAVGVDVKSFNASLLFEPWTVQSGSGTSYKVYTPFRKNVDQRPLPHPVTAPKGLTSQVPGTPDTPVPDTPKFVVPGTPVLQAAPHRGVGCDVG